MRGGERRSWRGEVGVDGDWGAEGSDGRATWKKYGQREQCWPRWIRRQRRQGGQCSQW